MNSSDTGSRQSSAPASSSAAVTAAKGYTRNGWAWRLLLLGALVPLFATILLHGLDVPLGKPGRFVYLYSPIFSQRIAALPPVIVLAALLAGGAFLLFSSHRTRRALGWTALTLASIGVSVWVYLAPPQFRSQHLFNMLSPSHDGAFLTEADYARQLGVRSYLRGFPRRAETPPAVMRGTRVISNPPGATLLAIAMNRALGALPGLARWIERWGVDEQEVDPQARRVIVGSLGFSATLWLLWLLAGPLLYGVGRVFLPPATAATFAVLCLFTPATLLFTPGKDTAQLLSVALPLWLWLLAWRRMSSWTAFSAGVAAVLVCLVSLVHFWIAAVLLIATLLAQPRGGVTRLVLRIVVPAAAGAFACVGVLYVAADLNLFATAWSVARAQAEVTRGDHAMPLVWQLLGVLFLLFAGPALWCAGLWLLRRRLADAEARFGLYLLLGCATVMVVTVGFTNVETPRLWIAFVPVLLLGMILQLASFRRPKRSVAVLLAALVFAQVAAAAVQWSLMDVREAETRLIEHEGGARFFD